MNHRICCLPVWTKLAMNGHCIQGIRVCTCYTSPRRWVNTSPSQARTIWTSSNRAVAGNMRILISPSWLCATGEFANNRSAARAGNQSGMDRASKRRERGRGSWPAEEHPCGQLSHGQSPLPARAARYCARILNCYANSTCSKVGLAVAGGRGNQPKAGNRQPAAACRQSAVWREQKRQANAIIQVAAVISCLISIINTRHRHGRQIPDSPSSLSPFLCASNRTMGTNHFICQACGLCCCCCWLNPHAQWPGNFDWQCNILF